MLHRVRLQRPSCGASDHQWHTVDFAIGQRALYFGEIEDGYYFRDISRIARYEKTSPVEIEIARLTYLDVLGCRTRSDEITIKKSLCSPITNVEIVVRKMYARRYKSTMVRKRACC